jgi:polygalacturonase
MKAVLILQVLLLFERAFALVCNIRDYGATGDGVFLEDKALEAALADCRDGGEILFPQGRYLLSPFNLTSNLGLNLEENSVILASTDIISWPLMEPLPSYTDSRKRYAAFIGGYDVHNVSIRGSGTIDGQGQLWWDAHAANTLSLERARLIEPMFCTNFSMLGVTVVNPPFWAIHPFACDKVLIENVKFSAPVNSPNTDGIDPDSCSEVTIRNFSATCGDDAIAIKCGKDENGRLFNRPSHDILIEGNIVITAF